MVSRYSNKGGSKNNNNNSTKSVKKNKKTDSTNIILVVGMLFMLLIIYYYMYMSNKEATMNEDGFTSATLSESELRPAKNEVVMGLFYADWCPHCQNFKPEWKKVQDELNGKVMENGLTPKLVSVDCEANPDLAKKYEINGYPTIKVIKPDGSVEEFTDDRSLSGIKSYLHNL